MNRCKSIVLFFVMLASCLYAQLEKADKFFARREYYKAIPLYEKAILSKGFADQQATLLKLGDAYRLQGLHPQAETTYKILLDLKADPPASLIYNYAQVLKSNRKYDEAANYYAKYIKLVPGDLNAAKSYRFCREISTYNAKAREYEVINVPEINSAKAEFSPFIMKGKLLYVAERGAYDAAKGSYDETESDLFLQYYYSDLTGIEAGKSKIFSELLAPEFHMGPACLSADGKTFYFTKVLPGKNKDAAAVSAVFSASYSPRGWIQTAQQNLGTGEAQAAQPSVSRDGNTIYFSSDMSGGFGGKDLWMCEKRGGAWSAPVNLGPDINTTGDEMFPTLRNDSVLYFSSNGLPGFGGLDIFSAMKITGKWILNRNEGLNINTNADDFGITFFNDSIGYFSSNREGGKGLDDIYRFKFRSKTTTLSGVLLLTENIKDYAQYKKLLLLEETGKTVDSTATDAKGYFKFRNLEVDKKYLVAVNETDPVLRKKARYYLAQNGAGIQRVSYRFNDNRFVFKNLPLQPGGLPELYTEGDLVFAGTLQYGSPAVPVSKVKVRLSNDFGDVIKECYTNVYGGFAFRNIPSDQDYLVSIDDSGIDIPEGTKIALLNKSGKEIRAFYKSKEWLKFRILQSDTSFLAAMNAEDTNLVMGIFGYLYDQNKRPIVHARIKIKQVDGEELQEWITDVFGRFLFKNLDADKNYLVELDQTDANLSSVRKIYIADNGGRMYKTVDLHDTKFTFKLLEADKFILGEFVVDDPWLKVANLKRNAGSRDSTQALSITIVENIYYAYGDFKLDVNAETILNKAAHAMQDNPKLIMEISSHTDSQASADFNLELSKKRAQAAVDYLINNGIAPGRLKATGFGESKLLNKCSDGQECSEEEHRVNRRTEFSIHEGE